MSKCWRTVLEIAAFVVVLAMGVWVRSANLNAPLPAPQEAPTLLGAAEINEGLDSSRWPEGAAEAASPFTFAAAMCARFVHDSQEKNPAARCYRIFGLTLAALLLIGIPALGLQRRGGVFETADGPLWAMAFAALSPALVWSGLFLTPAVGQLFVFLAMLVAARAYAQWPGYLSAALVGALVGLGLAVDPNVAWVLAALVPAIAVGVGWTRLCLYWRLTHVLTALAAWAVVWVPLMVFGWCGGAFRWPTLPVGIDEWVQGPAWRLGWLCGGALAILAWLGLTIWGGWRLGRRWARMVAVLFPLCLVGSLFFEKGGAFAVPLACLTPLMIGMALSTIPKSWMRGVLGCFGLVFLLSWLTGVGGVRWDRETRSRGEQKTSFATLTRAHEVAVRNRTHIRLAAEDPAAYAALLWPLRTESSRVAASDERVQAGVALLPKEQAAPKGWVDLGEVFLGEDLDFRAYAERLGETGVR